MRPRPRISAGLVVLLLVAIAATALIVWPPGRTEPLKPCGEMLPVTIGGSMVIGCR